MFMGIFLTIQSHGKKHTIATKRVKLLPKMTIQCRRAIDDHGRDEAVDS